VQLTIDIPDELADKAAAARERLSELIEQDLRRQSAGSRGVVQELFEFLAGDPSPEQIVDFRPSAQATGRLSELLNKNREGSLTAAEEAELDTLQSLDNWFALLKVQARQRLTPGL